MSLKLKAPPASEPVSLTDVKAYLRITDTDDDSFITALVSAVRQRCEAFTGRALVTQTWTLWLDGFPKRERRNSPLDGYFQLPVDHFDEVMRMIEISRPPLQSITLLKTYDTGNTAATFDAAGYFVDAASEPGRIALNSGSSWPVNLRAVNSVEIEFVAGYGTASNVPEPLKQGIFIWLKLLFANKSRLFESDEPTAGLVEFNREPLPPQVHSLWSPYKINNL